MEAVGNDPTQAYLCAGVLQTLELSIAQRLHKSFSKITASHYIRNLLERSDILGHRVWYCVWVTIPSSHLERVMTSPEVERSDIWYLVLVTIQPQCLIKTLLIHLS